MKSYVIMLLVAVVLGLTAFGGYYSWQASARTESSVPSAAGELAWLRKEFDLDAKQFRKVELLHGQYQPICEWLCDQVIEAKAALDQALLTTESYSGEVEEKLVKLSRVKEACNRSMLQHIFEVAAVMNEDQRRRYLEMARMQVTDHVNLH